jgi:hypothetical protein
MAQAAPPAAWTPPTNPPSSSSGSSGGKGGAGLATILAVVAIVLALIAMGLTFVVPGPKGPAGGPEQTPNVTFFAVVASDGALQRGSPNVNTSVQVGTGEYQVYFNTTLYDCTYWANLGTITDGTSGPGTATVTKVPHSVYGLAVVTYNATQAVDADAAFHLIVSCPGGLTAVVLSNGTFQSGANVNFTYQEGTGAYEVLFDQNVAGCAYTAGLGTSFSSSPGGSATTASRSGQLDGVWITTYNSGGTLTNETFHLSVYC